MKKEPKTEPKPAKTKASKKAAPAAPAAKAKSSQKKAAKVAPEATKPAKTKAKAEPKAATQLPEQKQEQGVTVTASGQIVVSDRLKEMARLATEPKEHRRYNKNQSKRVFEYKVYYGDASHEGNDHGNLDRVFGNLQTAINYIAKETKFYVEEGLERECYSIVLNGILIAEY